MNRFKVLMEMPVVLAIVLTGICAGAQNLITCGDFTAAAGNLTPECRAEAGKVSLFTEEYTWNKCGKCEVTKDESDREHPGCLIHAANDPEIAAFLRDAAVDVMDRHPNDAALPDRLRDKARELLVKVR